MTRRRFSLPALPAIESLRFSPIDGIVLLVVLLLVWVVGSLGRDMTEPFSIGTSPAISLEVWRIPYYAARSTIRMFIAYSWSFGFTLAIGYWAAHSKRARTLILPALDVLQSVPVLGFLSVTVTGFMALFPGSLFGVEMASIFAIFTGQVWNMTFGFYHSLVTIPEELIETAAVFRLNPWQRFKTVELPSSAISLIWNSMMSFGGGWFFVVQSETITVLNQKITLPGLGSYMALAIQKGNTRAAVYAIIAMVLIVVSIDQLIWRPVVCWSQKFRFEQTESADQNESWFLSFLRRSSAFKKAAEATAKKVSLFFDRLFESVLNRVPRGETGKYRAARAALAQTIFYGALAAIVFLSVKIAREIQTGLDLEKVRDVFGFGLLTMLRVFTMLVIATAVWTPIGVWIGFRPKAARFAQPLAQIAASFPVNMTFPFVVGFFVAKHIDMNWGSILLIGLGTQWYILFNVIAGASAIPTDLRESSQVFGLRGVGLWKKLILPAIFPYWVTGACTAAGGAWNASIVAEVATWGNVELRAKGLGAYIAEVTEKGDWPAIFCSIAVMAIFVVILNRLLWRNLYRLAEERFKLG